MTEKKKIRLPKYFSLYMFLVPGILLTVLFSYAAMPGLLIGFMDYNYFLGFKSPWVGLSNIRGNPSFCVNLKLGSKMII